MNRHLTQFHSPSIAIVTNTFQTCVVTRRSDHTVSIECNIECNIDSMHEVLNRNSSPQRNFPLVIVYAGTLYHI